VKATVLLAAGTLTAAAALVAVPSAQATTPDTPRAHGHVHALGTPGAAHARAAAVGPVLGYTNGAPPLNYQPGGSIQKSVTFYTIWWNPGHLQDGTVSNLGAAYKTLVRRFLADYSGNGLARNNTQYYGASGASANVHITATTHLGAAFTATTPYPVGHCTTTATGGNCVTNADLADLAAATAKAHAVAAGTNKMFLVFTPAREGSCFYGGACGDPDASYTGYCAFHSYTSAAYGAFPYLIYATWLGQQFPNGNTNADASINLVSHEVTEAITDPLLNNWFDNAGLEIGDECAWEFGPNVTWNTHPYSMQPEASNAAAGCVYDGP
jgi:hypothetical protein